MYDYKNDPLPKHTRWQTKQGELVLAVARFNSLGGYSCILFATIISFIVHFVASTKVTVIVFIAMFIAAEVLLRVLMNYYGLVAKYKVPLWRYILSIVVVLFILFLFRT